jgi:integrase
LNTRARKEEILSLKWDSVDLKHGFILLDKTKNGDRREIPINETLKATLQNSMRRLDIPYVFYDPVNGKRYKDVKRSFKTAIKRAGITDFRFHDLRHTFASHLVMAEVDLNNGKRVIRT